jgi:predicted ribosomally synthesized peptide with SipW-like signal peptide
MRRPPPIASFVRYPATAGTALLAIGATLAWWSDRIDVSRLFMTELAMPWEPWRLLTSTLLHGDVIHLLFNIYWLWVFGTAIEQVYGTLRTLGLFVLLAAGAMLAEFAVFDGGVGLSGVGYGLFGFLYAMRNDRRFHDCVDSSTTSLFVVWFFICIATTLMGIMMIANVAHGAGAVIGFLLGQTIATRRQWKPTFGSALVAFLLAIGVTSTFARPYVNFSPHRGYDLARAAYDALQADENQRAAKLLKSAVRLNPREAGWWYNLGLAYERIGQNEPAMQAFDRAYDLAPGEADFRGATISAKLAAASKAMQESRWADAERLARAATEIDPTDEHAWFAVAAAYQQQGLEAEAAEALSHTSHAQKPTGTDTSSGFFWWLFGGDPNRGPTSAPATTGPANNRQ